MKDQLGADFHDLPMSDIPANFTTPWLLKASPQREQHPRTDAQHKLKKTKNTPRPETLDPKTWASEGSGKLAQRNHS